MSNHHHDNNGRSASLPWKSVNVTLPEPTQDSSNHYDNHHPHTNNNVKDELEAVPGEHVAMFYGLEVLQGHEYTVNKNGELLLRCAAVVTTTEGGDGGIGGGHADQQQQQQQESNKRGVQKKERGNKKRKASSSTGNDMTSFSDTTATTTTPDDDEQLEATTELSIGDSHERRESKKKKKKKKQQQQPLQDQESTQKCPDDEQQQQQQQADKDVVVEVVDDVDVERMQTSWMIATGGVTLDPRICSSLVQQDFWMPTPIQSATLPAALMGRRNIVGAAPTGSGKTLAYLLPIVQYLLLLQPEKEENNAAPPVVLSHSHLLALILTPTRELALQVSRECDKLIPNKKQCGTIVGGLALQKQERILTKNKPPILVATPGRLWELMSSQKHTHLTELSQLRFLVIDEADRMIQQGSFPQLVCIFDSIHDANPMDSKNDEVEEIESDDIDENGRLLALPGIPGEARVTMLNDILLERLGQQQQENENCNGNGRSTVEPVEMDEDEFAKLANEDQVDNDEDDDDDDIISLPPPPPVSRQTFVYSATLMLPPSSSYVASKKVDTTTKKKKKGGKPKKQVTVEGAIAEILEKSRAKGQTKVVDLTSSVDKNSVLAPTTRSGGPGVARSSSAASPRLPPGLSLRKIECTQRHKDSHLYAYLVTTAQGASGPCLVFCNSIAAVRRVGATLDALRLPVRMLHANMPQKARFKAVESLREPKSRTIVVATDVAARGLDIPSVATVVHYDVARQVDTFIHRAGRTARGMGQGAVGLSLSLIAPGEDKAHDKVCEALQFSKHMFETVQMDGRLLAIAQERANLAAKIVECDEVEQKANRSNKWFQDAAEQAGLDLDDNILDEGLAGGDQRDQHKLREAKAARGQLRQLLAQPMQTQRFGKFLSSNSAAAADPEVATYVVPLTTMSRKKKKRKA